MCNLVDHLHEFPSYHAAKGKQFGVMDTVAKKYRMYDYCIPELKLIIEYHGDYWHGNPKKYKPSDLIRKKCALDLWNEDYQKTLAANSRGYEVVVVWEHDWKHNRNDVTKRLKVKIEQAAKTL